jgi:hypothetical protein
MREKFLPAIAVAIAVALSSGCGKHDSAATAPTSGSVPAFSGVQFYSDFASAAPEIKTLADKTLMSVQSGAFADALKYLGQLADNPALTELQKKSVESMTDQVKSKIAAETAAPR